MEALGKACLAAGLASASDSGDVWLRLSGRPPRFDSAQPAGAIHGGGEPSLAEAHRPAGAPGVTGSGAWPHEPRGLASG